MPVTSPAFQENAARALDDADLQKALVRMKAGFIDKRRRAVERLPEFDALRDSARDIKDHVLDNLDLYLERFEARVVESGGEVHWCADAHAARNKVLELCRAAGARSVTKSKSMIAEEIGLNDHLEAHGIEPVETDLGEYIIQLAHEPPSHIIAPAVHKSKEEVADLFVAHHAQYGLRERHAEARALVDEARKVLRQKYLDADVGITGANFLIAETGSSVTVTNEGNAELTQNLPATQIVVASLEKVVPTLEDATTILRVLARSATGQEFATYTTFSTGPRREGDADGPAAFHVVLLDNGRSGLLGGAFRDVLRCIRCGACLNHCPVYGVIGGHAYGWVYPGPMGAVLTPSLVGIERAGHLPNASTFCGKCEEVCPMRIPLPKMMRHWREREFAQRLSPPRYRTGLALWAWFAERPALYRLATRIAVAALAALAGRKRRFAALPGAGGWTAGRDLPAPVGRTFQDLWAAQQRSGR
ncbi:MAG: LutB/LldF family L-lactate oxidation iron-sulfur protein [Alphaproteobacteria bacterium]